MTMKVGILGGGESGIGAALLAKKQDYEIFLSDEGIITETFRSELILHNIPFEEKGHSIDRLERMDVLVKSPGIPNDAPVILELHAKGLSAISEIEWAYRHCAGKILGITGSNGKTTTTMLCYHLMQHAGVDVALCGNVGTGFCRVLTEEERAWYVVEISSFQLDDVDTFRPDIGILLNITPDHLNRYGGSMLRYAEAKMKIAGKMRPDDILIYNEQDTVILDMLNLQSYDCELLGVTKADSAEFGVPSIALPGAHNALNAACAIAALRRVGVSDDAIRDGLATFKRPEHRMELVAVINGVTYINDSKATNVDSVYYALDAVQSPVIWIAGGQDKGNHYEQLSDLVRAKVKKLICLGIDNKNLLQAFSSKVDDIEETTSMFEAVAMAASNASSEDTVLLSPACASFDLFKNYMHRGALFKEEVLKLKKG
jgi:UDP-N-acetylmuramoylalanine--D-glutamate ligase